MTLKWKKLKPKMVSKWDTDNTKQKEKNSIMDLVKFKFFCLSKYHSMYVEVRRIYFRYMVPTKVSCLKYI